MISLSRPPSPTLVDGVDAAVDDVAGRADTRYAFLTRSWFAGAARTLIARRADGMPAIALPLAPIRFGLQAVPGSYWPFRSFPVAADLATEEMHGLLTGPVARKALGRAWRLGPVAADDPALLALRAAAPATGWTIWQRRIATSFVLDIDEARAEGPWPRNSTLRKNRFHEKHLAGHGALEWRFVRGAEWTPEIFDALAAIEAKSWHASSADSKFLNAHNRAFWERLAADPAMAERMNAAILFVAGAPAAFSFDLDSGATRYAIANSYDPAFAKHSPGKLLYYRNLVDAIERGIRRVDWGAGDAGYKTTLGAHPAAEIVDCLIVRRFPGSALAGKLWTRSGKPPV